MAAPNNADIYFFDKLYCQLLGYRYRNSNEFAGNVRERIAELIEEVFYGGSSTGQGPTCHCKAISDIKCYDNDCILRPLKIECAATCGDGCQNHTLTNGAFSTRLEIESRIGYGIVLVTKMPIPKGKPIVEYIGKVQEGQLYFNQEHCFPLRRFINNKVYIYINQEREGNECRYLFHSSEPNCDMEEWIVDRTLRLMVVAKEDINANEPLTMYFPQRGPEPKDNREAEFLPSGDLDEYPDKVENTKTSVVPKRCLVREPADKPLPKKNKRGMKYQCHVPNCTYKYNKVEQVISHFEKKHTVNKGAIPDAQEKVKDVPQAVGRNRTPPLNPDTDSDVPDEEEDED